MPHPGPELLRSRPAWATICKQYTRFSMVWQWENDPIRTTAIYCRIVLTIIPSGQKGQEAIYVHDGSPGQRRDLGQDQVEGMLRVGELYQNGGHARQTELVV